MTRRIFPTVAVVFGLAVWSGCGEPTEPDDGQEPTFGVSQNDDTDGIGDEFCERDGDGWSCSVDCRDADSWPEAWTILAGSLVDEINDRRAAGVDCESGPRDSAVELDVDDRLAEAARCHALDMAENDFFDHEGSDGSDVVDRAEAAGFDSQIVGENLAVGQTTAVDVADAWVDSDGHCRNLSHPPYRVTGAAVVEVAGQRYWVQKYGRSP